MSVSLSAAPAPSRLQGWMVLLLFLAAALPFAASFYFYQPDERHYTNAALFMRTHGDWLTPHTAEGAPRFLKPILTYWIITAGWALTGVNVLGSRLGSLLAALLTLWLTHRLAHRLTGCARTATLAALILASHLQFLSAAARANPDALLVLFTLMSLEGFFSAMTTPTRNAPACWLAYGGAALAVETKGLLGAGLVFFAWGFVIVREHKFAALKKLLHWPSLLAAATIGGAWFAYIFTQHGSAALGSFYDDQVESKVGYWWTPLVGAPKYAGLLALNFLPWTLPALEAWSRGARGGKLSPVASRLTLAWATVVVIVFSAGGYVTVRYLLPAAPLLCIWLADLLTTNADQRRLVCCPRRLALVLLTLAAVATLLGLLLHTETGWSAAAVAGGAGLLGIIGAVMFTARRKIFSAGESLGLAMLVFFIVAFYTASPVVLPERAEQIAAALRQTPNVTTVVVVGEEKLASRIRVLLAGQREVRFAPTLADVPPGAHRIVFGAAADELRARGVPLVNVATAVKALRGREFFSALHERRLGEAMRVRGQDYFLAAP
jgi:4-amino-4-deoxy-L-arabinose transferase-like glycosyltransferase